MHLCSVNPALQLEKAQAEKKKSHPETFSLEMNFSGDPFIKQTATAPCHVWDAEGTLGGFQ